jgi:hypothetical protein
MPSIRNGRLSAYPRDLADDQVLTLPDFAKIAGISVPTLRRRIAGGDGPVITKLSERRIGIRVRHGRAWLDERACTADGHNPSRAINYPGRGGARRG